MASMYEIEEVLHPQVITDMYREEAGKFFNSPFLDFYNTQIKEIGGDRFQFAYRAAMKEPAPASQRGQPARVLQPTGLKENIVYMLHAFNELDLGMNGLQMIRNPNDTTLQRMGREEIARQVEDFGDRHLIFRALCHAKTFVDGEISFNSSGQVLESSSGALYTVDFGVPATHKNQLTAVSGSYPGAIIDRSWADPTASIFGQLDNLGIAAGEVNAEGPMHVWAHPFMKRYLRANDEVLEWASRGGSPSTAEAILRGQTIDDLNGFTWHFFGGTYTAVDGTTKPYIPTNKIVITPEVGPWLKAANGSELITTFEGIKSNWTEALSAVTEVFGDFAYAKLVDNPTKLVLRMGTNFVYAFANPNAIWMPTVVF